VAYFEVSDKVKYVCKIKTLDYRFLRKIREILKYPPSKIFQTIEKYARDIRKLASGYIPPHEFARYEKILEQSLLLHH
jgi:hypothetical protein